MQGRFQAPKIGLAFHTTKGGRILPCCYACLSVLSGMINIESALKFVSTNFRWGVASSQYACDSFNNRDSTSCDTHLRLSLDALSVGLSNNCMLNSSYGDDIDLVAVEIVSRNRPFSAMLLSTALKQEKQNGDRPVVSRYCETDTLVYHNCVGIVRTEDNTVYHNKNRVLLIWDPSQSGRMHLMSGRSTDGYTDDDDILSIRLTKWGSSPMCSLPFPSTKTWTDLPQLLKSYSLEVDHQV